MRQFRSDDTSIWQDKFGNGSDGAASINTSTDAAANTTLTGTSGATSATVGSGTGFVANNIVLIHQSQGTGAGNWELNRIVSIGSGTNWTLAYPLQNTYGAGAQVYLLKQYSSVTVNSGQTLTGRAWNGTTGGIVAFLVSGAFTIAATGILTASQTGFRGGRAQHSGGASDSGEGNPGLGSYSQNANGNGGGADIDYNAATGGGGGNANAGSNGSGSAQRGTGGNAVGNAGLTSAFFGGGGGNAWDNANQAPQPPPGGGFILIIANTITVTGTITNKGGDGTAAPSSVGTGGSAGGSTLLKGQTITLGTSLVTALAGAGGVGSSRTGGAGSVGRIHADYSAALTGTTNPTLDSRNDLTVAPNTGGMFLFNFL